MRDLPARLFWYVLLLGWAAPCTALAQTGNVELVMSGMRKISRLEMGDTTLTVASASGTLTVTTSSGPPFNAGQSAGIEFVMHARTMATSFELEANGVARFADGDQLFLNFKRKGGDLAPGTSARGSQSILGGTGRFSGVTGDCEYRVDNLAGDWSVTSSRCQWRR